MASMQRRLGPNHVADALKLILKEYVAPTQSNIILFFLGPVITLIFALLGFAGIIAKFRGSPKAYFTKLNMKIFMWMN
ncbi:NADH-ubiquinone oxidoreductase chain 1 (mitochondrion) [Ceratocystis fimbriata CBS 114723]|uniref:NADH-ubiquinone oxidoreductase chain 1 n=1 Tax=Ceratocystis fimbriata CBS 114723 TaxID=1035309 RepID=A0A2C5WSC7_9PEZI|nr:NADH-ubiquinone oxidoreductase chain 1 [Ceratocystis fimbriata CBS 114723]